jgi:hypothetical protein
MALGSENDLEAPSYPEFGLLERWFMTACDLHGENVSLPGRFLPRQKTNYFLSG